MSQNHITSYGNDPQLEQIITPEVFKNNGWQNYLNDDLPIHREFAIYYRRGETTNHYCVTHHNIVIMLTTVLPAAQLTAQGRRLGRRQK